MTKGAASNSWKPLLVPVVQFVIPTEVRGVLDGWEKKRKLQEELKKAQPTVDGLETDENKTEIQTKTESRDEVGRGEWRKKGANTVPPLPIGRQKKLTNVVRKPQELPQLGRTNSKSAIISWQTEPVSQPKTAEEPPPQLPPKPPSRGRKSEVSTHLSNSINEYNEIRHGGGSFVDALTKTATHARTILRDPRRQEIDFDLFNTEQVLSSATVSKEKELEEKLSKLFASISTSSKTQFKLKSDLTLGRNRPVPKPRSRSWKREQAL